MGLSTFVGGSWVALFAMSLVVCIAGYVSGHLILVRLGRAAARGEAQISLTPYVMTTMFALFLGFMASDIWSENRRANDTAGLEKLALERLERFAAVAGPGFDGFMQAIADYRTAVIEQEWGRGRNTASVPQVDDALDRMWSMALAAERDGTAPVFASDVVMAIDQLEIQRATRLTTGRVHEYDAWLIVFVLAYFSFCSIGFAHLDRPAAGRTNLVLFTAASLLVFGFLAVMDGPYDGLALHPTILAGDAG